MSLRVIYTRLALFDTPSSGYRIPGMGKGEV